MTFSITARCERTGQLGVAAITTMVGVGKLVPYVEAQVGAVASQAMINPYLGLDGVRHMRDALPAPDALSAVSPAASELLGGVGAQRMFVTTMVKTLHRAGWVMADFPVPIDGYEQSTPPS